MKLQDVEIRLKALTLKGLWGDNPKAKASIVFAHGSGSSRLSSRNQQVAAYLYDHGFSVLLFDLLTPAEDRDYQNRFDIPLITERLVAVGHWLLERQKKQPLPLGFFGASTGSASALSAALKMPEVYAVVSRGGRPDLAVGNLSHLRCPVLLIVGERDEDVLALNEKVYAGLSCVKALEVVPTATHLFEEPGTLEEVSRLTAAWFKKNLPGGKKHV